MTEQERIDHYHRVLPFPRSLFLGGDGRIVGTWIMGQNYRTASTLYGSYPNGYLKRVRALFPDKRSVLHLFSGHVDLEACPGDTVDVNPEARPTYLCDAQQDLGRVPFGAYDLVLADPPYSVEDAEHYGAPMITRNRVFRQLAARCAPRTHVVWLDQVLPMHRKTDWAIVGVIGMVKSACHRFRVVTLFERRRLGNVAAQALR